MSQPNAGSAGLTTVQAADAFVNELSAEAKRAVMSSLLRDFIRAAGGNAAVPFDSPDGQVLGYYLPPTWSTPRQVTKPVLTPDEDAAIRRALGTPEDTCNPEDVFTRLGRADRG
jgi:hypothetical protein